MSPSLLLLFKKLIYLWLIQKILKHNILVKSYFGEIYMSKKKCCKSENHCEEVIPGDGKAACDDKNCVVVLEDAELVELREFDKKLNELKLQIGHIFLERRKLLKSGSTKSRQLVIELIGEDLNQGLI
jgi:hypothetical protein